MATTTRKRRVRHVEGHARHVSKAPSLEEIDNGMYAGSNRRTRVRLPHDSLVGPYSITHQEFIAATSGG